MKTWQVCRLGKTIVVLVFQAKDRRSALAAARRALGDVKPLEVRPFAHLHIEVDRKP